MAKKSETSRVTPKKEKPKLSLAEAMDLKEPVTESQTICLVGDLSDDVKAKFKLAQSAQRVADASPAGTELREGLEEALAEAMSQYEAAQSLVDENSIEFVFRAIGNTALEELMAAHKPTPAQNKKLQQDLRDQGLSANSERLQWNPDSFPAVMLSAALAEPASTEEECKALWDDPRWSRGELNTLLNLAYGVNDVVK